MTNKKQKYIITLLVDNREWNSQPIEGELGNLQSIIDEALEYMEPRATRKQKALIDVIKNLKTRETFTPTAKGKKRHHYLDKIRKQDITKILSNDKRILDWWKNI